MLKKITSVFIAAMLIVTAWSFVAFAQEDSSSVSDLFSGSVSGNKDSATQEDKEDSINLSGLLSGLVSGIKEAAEQVTEGDGTNLSDLLSGLVSGNAEKAEQESEGEDFHLSDLLSGLVSGNKEDAAQESEGSSISLSDLLSGVLSGLKDADLSSENLTGLFSSLLGGSDGSGGGSLISSWTPSFEWTIVTEDYGYKLPDEAAAAFEAAAKKLLGKTYTPIALLETQVVAGMNYRILCVGTAITPDAVPELDVLTIYQDLQGNVSVTDVTAVDLNVIYGLLGTEVEEEDGNLAGGWSIPEEEEKLSLPEKVVKSVEDYSRGMEDGYTYQPVAVLGTTIDDNNMLTTAVLVKMTSEKDGQNRKYEVLFLAEDEEGWVGGIYRAPLDLNRLLAQREDIPEDSEE